MPADKYEQLWQNVCEQVKTYENIDGKIVDAIFSRLHPQAYSDGFLMLTAENAFIKEWVIPRFLSKIEQALEDLYGIPYKVIIEVDPTFSTPVDTPQTTQTLMNKEAAAAQDQSLKEATSSSNLADPANFSDASSTLVSDFTFENFVVGSSNSIAYQTALEVAESPGSSLNNPYFVYGRSGLGKTHLLRAIQNYIAGVYPHMKTVYVDTMELVDGVSQAGAADTINKNKVFREFRQQYMDCDVLLIDDVQSLQHKDATTNLVFQIINNLIDKGHQIVFSADISPKNIDIDERYTSRFSAGNVCEITTPENETKLGIIGNYIQDCKKKGLLDFDISPEVQEYVAYISSSNIRELKSAITRIISYGKNKHKSNFTVEEVSQLLKDHFTGGVGKKITVAAIQKAVEDYYGITHAELVSKSRRQNIAQPRQIAMYLCRSMIDIPFSSIGAEFNKEHATVMYSVNLVEDRLKNDKELNESLDIIKKIILE